MNTVNNKEFSNSKLNTENSEPRILKPKDNKIEIEFSIKDIKDITENSLKERKIRNNRNRTSA